MYKSLFVISTFVILLLTTSCFSPRKKKEETKDKEAEFKIIKQMRENAGFSGCTENGLSISNDGGLFCVMNGELNDYLFTMLANGDSAKTKKLHGTTNDRGGITITRGNGLTVANNKLYGVTEDGGENGEGTIYSIDATTQSFEIEYEFPTKENLRPISLPVFDNDNSLIGLSENQWDRKLYWYVYDIELKKITKKVECKTDFFKYGYVPRSLGVQLGSDKCIYITDEFAPDKSSCILKVDKNLENIVLLHKMNSKIAKEPIGELVFMNNKIYGLCRSGGQTDDGLIYSINMDGSGFEALKSFNGDDGSVPSCLFKASDGNLYGTCYRGGVYDNGSFFQFNPKSNELSILKHFRGTEAAHPNGKIVEAVDGTLYGFLRHGGKNEEGALYSIKPQLK